MRVLILGYVLACACMSALAAEQEDMGTVIGIDLGTTYSV